MLALLRENQSKISKGKLIVTAKLTGTGRAVDHEHIESILFIEQFSRVIRTEWQLRIIKKHIVRTFDRVFDSHSLREMRKPCVNVEFREVELVFVHQRESSEPQRPRLAKGMRKPGDRMISLESPLGQCLIGAHVGLGMSFLGADGHKVHYTAFALTVRIGKLR